MFQSAQNHLDEACRRRLEALAGKEVVTWRRSERGHTAAERWQLTFADGSTAFAKLGTSVATAQRLRAEGAVYGRVSGPFMPALLGFDDHPERPLLLLEDLSAASWPPPLGPGELERLLRALRAMASTEVPRGTLAELERDRARLAGWLDVERDPAPFLSLGLCSAAWLETALPSLLIAQDLSWLGGSELVHGDLRGDDLCFVGERVVLTGWHAARRGNSMFDLARLAPSLRLHGGPPPDELLPGEGPLAALQSGYFAANAGLPPLVEAPGLRHLQLRQLRVALPWAARALGLPPPDVDWLERVSARRDAALAAGEIDERSWSEAAEEALGDAHLASAEPRVAAGRVADERVLRAADELVLDALPEREVARSVLLIGPASAWALDGLVRAAGERGVSVDVEALDPSPRLEAAARARWPERAERLASGALLGHVPRRRYDLVVTSLGDVPPARRRAWLEQLLASAVAPGGRVALRPEPALDGAHPSRELAALGLPAGGALQRANPAQGPGLCSAWLARA